MRGEQRDWSINLCRIWFQGGVKVRKKEKVDTKGMFRNADKWMMNDFTLIRNIAIFHCCQWNKGISNIALVTGFFIIETLAASCAHSSSLIKWAKATTLWQLQTALDEESAFQVARQTLQVIYPLLKHLIVFPQHYYLFIYFFPGFSIVNITFHPVPLGRIKSPGSFIFPWLNLCWWKAWLFSLLW